MHAHLLRWVAYHSMPAALASKSSVLGSGRKRMESVVRLTTRWASKLEVLSPRRVSLLGETSVTVPPPPDVRFQEPIATTSGSGAPPLVRPVNVSLPGVHA